MSNITDLQAYRLSRQMPLYSTGILSAYHMLEVNRAVNIELVECYPTNPSRQGGVTPVHHADASDVGLSDGIPASALVVSGA